MIRKDVWSKFAFVINLTYWTNLSNSQPSRAIQYFDIGIQCLRDVERYHWYLSTIGGKTNRYSFQRSFLVQIRDATISIRRIFSFIRQDTQPSGYLGLYISCLKGAHLNISIMVSIPNVRELRQLSWFVVSIPIFDTYRIVMGTLRSPGVVVIWHLCL